MCDFSFRISNNLGHNNYSCNRIEYVICMKVMVYLFFKRRINGQTIKFKPHSLLHPSFEHLELFQIQHITYKKYLYRVCLRWQIWEVYELFQFNDWHIFIYLITLSTANLFLHNYLLFDKSSFILLHFLYCKPLYNYLTNLHLSQYNLHTANLYLIISKKTLKCLKN